MGIDVGGGMIIGADCDSVIESVKVNIDDCEMYGTEGNYFEEFYEWDGEVGMSCYSYWYDAGSDGQVIGFTMNDIETLSDDFEDWVVDVKERSLKFKELTGVEPKLIGMQDVW